MKNLSKYERGLLFLILFSGMSFIILKCSSPKQNYTFDHGKNKALELIDSLFQIRAYEEAQNEIKNELSKKKGNTFSKGELLLRLHQVLNYLEKYDSSELVFDEILSVSDSLLDLKNKGVLKGSAYLNKAKLFQDAELFDSSQIPLNQARKFLKNYDPEKTAYSLILSAKLAYINYKEQNAIRFLKTAQELRKRNQFKRYTENLIDNWFSIIYQELGEYEQSIKHNKDILARLEAENFDSLQQEELTLLVHTYQNLGTLSDWKGEVKDSQNFYKRALYILSNYQKTDSIEIAQLHNNVGVAYITSNEYVRAIESFRKSCTLLPPAKIKETGIKIRVQALGSISFCFQSLGMADSSLLYAQKANDFQGIRTLEEDFIYLNLARAYFEKGDFHKAFEYSKLSEKTSISIHGKKGRYVASAQRLKGRILERLGKNEEAIIAFQEAIASLSWLFEYESMGENPELSYVYNKRDLLHNLKNKIFNLILVGKRTEVDSPKILAAWNTVEFSLDVINFLRKDYESDESKFHLLSLAMPVYEMGLQTATLLDRGKNGSKILEEAFRISEQGKGMILQDNLRAAQALQSPDIPADLKRKEDNLRINVAFYGQRVSFFESQEKLTAYDSTQYQTAQRIYLESEEEYSKLMQFMEENYDEYKRRKNAAEEESLPEIFHYLDSTNLSMLEYFWGEKAIYAFRLHKGEIRMYEIEKDSSLLNDIDFFRKQVSDASEVYNRGNSSEAFESYKQTGFRIYQRLLEPLLKDVEEGQDLVIIPDGQLNVFPFEALPYQADSLSQSFRDLNYLIQKHQIHYALSANLLLKNIVHNENNYGFLGYAPSYEGARKLDFNTQEVNQIADLVNGEARVGASAKKTDFLEEADEWQFLHMAQHAIKAEDPMMSHLLFSKDEKKKDTLSSGADPQRLFAYEIYNQRIDCELAVLNACETGEGKMAQGEGMLSLSRAFRHAGAESVIMNKWAVNDESSYHILSEFYRYLKAGESTASALRNAKLYYLNNSNKAHPYFWAGSALIGSSSELTFSEGNVFNLNRKEDLYLFILICCLGMAFFMGVFYRIQRKRRDRAALFKDL